MPTTPQVKFVFKNNNVQTSVPLLGVSHVIARTTKGPFNDPSTLLSSYPQFQRIFGEEIVPDGSVSNIKRAFQLGSRIRVSRVEGAEGATYGYAYDTAEATHSEVEIVLTDPVSDATLTLTLEVRTKEAGSPVLDNSGYNLNRPFYLQFSETQKAKKIWSIAQYKDKTNLTAENLIESGNFLSGSDAEGNTFVEASTLRNYINTVNNIEFVFKAAEGSSDELEEVAGRVRNMDGVLSVLTNYSNWSPNVTISSTEITTPKVLTIKEGTDGGDPSSDSVIKAYDALADYIDGYQLILSHLHQSSFQKKAEEGELYEADVNGYTDALTAIAEDVVAKFETVLYVEVPKYQSTGDGSTPQTAATFVDTLETLQGSLGYHKNIAYFGGGIKYYDDNGALQDCDVLGSIIGLGDASASSYGPWYSFAGMNRGILSDAQGPVMENLGTPSKVESLQEIADYYGNVIVMKNTPSQGLQTMLWHCFSSNNRDDSEKFLSIVRLNLYLKKNIRPIMESYLEEPNTFSTWQDIYLEVKNKVLDPLVGTAMTEYTWQGDQDATSYDDLQVNNEADVRQGKYKALLKYRDIVPMQEVTLEITIDAASQSVSVNPVE